MKLEKITITNFRSLHQTITIKEGRSRLFAFVGANNLGKSNILRAINLFLNKEVEPGLPYNPTTDLCETNKRSIISITFKFSNSDDKRMITYLNKKHSGEFKNYTVPITLACQPNGRLQYSFSGAKGRRKSFPELLTRIHSYINCIYIPAIKDYRSVIDTQMMRKIVAATFQGWGKGRYGSKTIGEQKEKFRKLLNEIQIVLDESGDYVSEIISSVVPSISRFAFTLPYDNLEEFLGKLLFTIDEEHLERSITLGCVGSGVQSFAIFSMLRLLHEIRPTNTYKKSRFIWLIEEPETFMHHDLQHQTYEKLKEYAKLGHIFLTTHSPVFIDKHKFKSSYVVTHNGKTTEINRVTSKNLRNVIAGNLGITFNDFFPFNRFNILVEGKTDRDLLMALNLLFKSAGSSDDFLDLSETEFLVCGSANSIPHFYQMYNVFNRYADFIALFDRDNSGLRAREKLIKEGVGNADLILVPTSSYKEKNAIEDIVYKLVWDDCIRKLDADGLVNIVMSQGKIKDYQFHLKDRIEVKKRFSKYLIEHAKKDLRPFKKFHDLILLLAKRLDKKRVAT